MQREMWTYQQFTDMWDKHKRNVFLAGCFVLVFLCGYGAGKFNKENSPQRKAQVNYTKKDAPGQNLATGGEGEVKGVAASSSPATIKPTGTDCKIKGNISSGGKKIYHVPGGASYKTVKPEECFNTESEAVAAGFIKSLR